MQALDCQPVNNGHFWYQRHERITMLAAHVIHVGGWVKGHKVIAFVGPDSGSVHRAHEV